MSRQKKLVIILNYLRFFVFLLKNIKKLQKILKKFCLTTKQTPIEKVWMGRENADQRRFEGIFSSMPDGFFLADQRSNLASRPFFFHVRNPVGTR